MHNATPGYNVARMRDDIAAMGWSTVDVARCACISRRTVDRFLAGEHQTAKMAKKIAVALGHGVRRYLIPRERVSA